MILSDQIAKRIRSIAALSGFTIGAVLGMRDSGALRAHKFNAGDWTYLDPVYIVLYGGTGALMAWEVGRCLTSFRTRPERSPRLSEQVVQGFTRLIAAVIGLRLAHEAAHLAPSIWDQWISTAQTAAEQDREQAHVWTGVLFSCGGALIALGYRVGRRLAPASGFIGAYLGLDAVRHVRPRVADLYWGPYTSSDHVFFVWWIADLISIGILVPCFAAVAYWSARSLTVACTTAGFAAAAALGAWMGFEVQAFYFNDLEWRVLEEVLFFLLGGLGALAGCALGRWIAELRARSRALPAARDWTAMLSGSLLRIAMAGVGLWLGAEAGYWVALLWDEYVIAAPFAYGEIALAWIVAGCAIGGALAVLGYRAGHRAPVAAAFLGALLAFALGPHWSPMQEHLHWGPFPSSDVHAELWRRSLLVTGMLAAGLGVLGYLLARWLRPRAKSPAV